MKRKFILSILGMVVVFCVQSCIKEDNSVEHKPSDVLTPQQQAELNTYIKKLSETIQFDGVTFMDIEAYKKTPEAVYSLFKSQSPYKLVTNTPVKTLEMPPVQNQAGEGSCTAFAIGYAGISYYLHTIKNLPYTTTGALRSPEYLYNTTKYKDLCGSGAIMTTVLNSVVNKGVCSWSEMPYTAGDCSLQPNTSQNQAAISGKVAYYKRLPNTQVSTIRDYIYLGYPVIMAFSVDECFIAQTRFAPYTYRSKGGKNWGGHAVTIIGYDDTKKLLKVQNSWGTGVHDKGYFYISYDIFPSIARELYVMFPNR